MKFGNCVSGRCLLATTLKIAEYQVKLLIWHGSWSRNYGSDAWPVYGAYALKRLSKSMTETPKVNGERTETIAHHKISVTGGWKVCHSNCSQTIWGGWNMSLDSLDEPTDWVSNKTIINLKNFSLTGIKWRQYIENKRGNSRAAWSLLQWVLVLTH